MARIRTQRGMGPLLKEMRTNPVAAVVNGVLGVGSILGVGILIVGRGIRYARRSVPEPGRQQILQGSSLLFVGLSILFLLGGIGFVLFALVQITTSLRVLETVGKVTLNPLLGQGYLLEHETDTAV